MRPRAAIVLKLAVAAIVAVSYPYLELAWKCRAAAASSEGCIWGRAYFPLARWVEPLLVAPVAFVAIMFIDRYVIRRGRALAESRYQWRAVAEAFAAQYRALLPVPAARVAGVSASS